MFESSIKILPIQESQVLVNTSSKKSKKKDKELQRTKKWRKKRRGRWTGSQLKNLMSSGPGKSKLKWDNLDRVYSFGATSVKYIYENSMERKTGRYIEDGEGTEAMRYGTKVEPLIRKRTKELLEEMKVVGKLKDVGFKTFDNLKTAGVSSDSILVNDKGETIASVEMKACTSWGTHYERTYDIMTDSSKDFWQVQGQTVAHNVPICYYVVAEPPQNIRDYLYYDRDIKDLYRQFKKECKVSIQIVMKSEQHCEALIKRIILAEETIRDFKETNYTEKLKPLLENNIKIHEDKPEKFERYLKKAS